MRKRCWSLACIVLLSMVTATLQAGTVAWWRFEEGPADACAQTGFVIMDWSGNGNHLDPFTADCDNAEAGFRYRDLVGWSELPLTGDTNNYSWRTTGLFPASMTDSAITEPAGIDAEAIEPTQWTVEATIKVSQYEPRWRCFVGRDSHGLWTQASYGIGATRNESSFYLQVNNQNQPGVRYVDVSGYRHLAQGPAGYIQGFNPDVDPDGLQAPWYHLAAVSDGDTLSLWIAEEGGNYVLLDRLDMTTSGSADRSLSAGLGTHPAWGHTWHGGGWTVGRGLWDSWHEDRGRGFIDEVRISNHALETHEFLGYYRTMARNPQPGDYSGDAEPSVTLSWDAPVDPADAGQVHPELVKYVLNLQESGTDPNWRAPIEITPTGLTESYGPIALGMDVSNFAWRVDTVLATETKEGQLWHFGTRASVPVITSQPSPRYQLAHAGDELTIDIEVQSESAVEYSWRRENPDGEDVEVGTSATLALGPIAVEDEGHYYCVVSNDSGALVESARASVGFAREVAYWPINGDYLDASGEGHDATVAGTATFREGVNGDPNGAMQVVDAANGWATAGTWNPSEYSNQLTVSLWLHWDGPVQNWQQVIGKRDGGYNNMDEMWQLTTGFNDEYLLRFEAAGGVTANGVLARGWQHVVNTYDGKTLRIYHNGVLKGSTTAFSFHYNAVDKVITLGASSGLEQPVGNLLNGALDDIRIYNYAISELDVADLYRAVTGESVCLESERPDARLDADGNCMIDLNDFATFMQGWLECGLLPDCVQ